MCKTFGLDNCLCLNKWCPHTLSLSHLMSHIDAPTVQAVDVLLTLVREATDESVVTENDASHLSHILVTLIIADVATVIHQAGHQVAPSPLLLIALLNLNSWTCDSTVRILIRVSEILKGICEVHGADWPQRCCSCRPPWPLTQTLYPWSGWVCSSTEADAKKQEKHHSKQLHIL